MSKINDYARFVDSCTSETSKDTTKMCDRLDRLMGTHSVFQGKIVECEIDMARLMTALIGMMAESGEFAEVVKKKVFQADTQFSNDEIFHMKRELGDIMWYWTTACASLGLDPFEVISENQKKLEARYGEKFEIQRSEVRKEGDL